MRATPDTRSPEPNDTLTVRFKVRDAYVPSPEALLEALFGDSVLEGTVVARARNDPDNTAVVVQLDERDVLVVIPARRLSATARVSPLTRR